MANSWFQFRQFRIDQARAAFKVGTDASLLGSWTPAAGASTILDIGSGTGVIALMLAQRNPHALIDAIEPDTDSYLQASENFASSPWSSRLRCFHTSLQDYAPAAGAYDLVVSNPPFFAGSTKNPDTRKSSTRHEETLSLETLLEISHKLLGDRGQLALILPFERRKDFETTCARQGWHEQRCLRIRPTAYKPFHRFISVIATREAGHTEVSEITLFLSHNLYTPEAAELLKPFYLRL